METLKDRILFLLKEKGITKAEFANKLNITQAYVSKITNKGAIPSNRLIEDICEKFGLNEQWLLNGKGEMYSETSKEKQLTLWATTALKYESDDFTKRFIKALSLLDIEEWKLLEKICLKIHNSDENN